jgi:uncharacterized Rmd1/YagE family protein
MPTRPHDRGCPHAPGLAADPASGSVRAVSTETPIVQAKAWALGARLDLRRLSDENLVAAGPHTYDLGNGQFLSAFRYGAVVFFGLSETEQAERLVRLASFVSDPFERTESESLEIRVMAAEREGLNTDGALVLHRFGITEAQLVAHALAKSAVLTHYEQHVTQAFSRVEQRIEGRARGTTRRQSRELIEEMRAALAIQVQTIGRVEMTEKPELLWEDPRLDRLYELIAAEFELRERDAALTRKLAIISESAATSLELIHTGQSLRVEWYIVVLIVIEIALVLYELVAD